MSQNIYLRVALLFGLISAGLVLVYFFTLYVLGGNPLPEMNRLDILIILACTLFAIGYFRDRKNRGILHFWQGLLIGLSVVLISTLLSSLVIYGFMQYKPEVFQVYVQSMEKLIQTDYQAGRIKDVTRYKQLLQSLPAITPSGRAIDIFIKNFFIGFFATGILTMIMRKHPQQSQSK